MKKIFILLLFSCNFFSCNNDDCKTEEKDLYYGSGTGIRDTNQSSPFFNQIVLYLGVYVKSKVESGEFCKGITCIETSAMDVANLTPQDMNLTLTLAGKGDFTFSITKGDTISINPLPDFCINNSWGSVKSIVYK